MEPIKSAWRRRLSIGGLELADYLVVPGRARLNCYFIKQVYKLLVPVHRIAHAARWIFDKKKGLGDGDGHDFSTSKVAAKCGATGTMTHEFIRLTKKAPIFSTPKLYV